MVYQCARCGEWEYSFSTFPCSVDLFNALTLEEALEAAEKLCEWARERIDVEKQLRRIARREHRERCKIGWHQPPVSKPSQRLERRPEWPFRLSMGNANRWD